MTDANFDAMTLAELGGYVLTHREDINAFPTGEGVGDVELALPEGWANLQNWDTPR